MQKNERNGGRYWRIDDGRVKNEKMREKRKEE